MKNIINKLYETKNLTDSEFIKLLEDESMDEYLFSLSGKVRNSVFENKIYIRGLIEISNYCKNNCYYCGIRASNRDIERYRLSKEDIMECCFYGYEAGFRTFVLQGGEDNTFTDEFLCDILKKIKNEFKDCAITLSVGERSYESYRQLYECGADRYLLRHETASASHYEMLHPKQMKLENRKECLYNLKKIGYQVGSGFMVGSPYQKMENIVNDIRFLQKLSPHMIGIGPFIPHCSTPFANEKAGSVNLTVKLIAVLRILFPKALIPATTALNTLSENGRIKALKSGANVIMPNLSPDDVRKLYTLYDRKASSGKEAAEGLNLLKEYVRKEGFEIVVDRGDYPGSLIES